MMMMMMMMTMMIVIIIIIVIMMMMLIIIIIIIYYYQTHSRARGGAELRTSSARRFPERRANAIPGANMAAVCLFIQGEPLV